jgi:hypothetical protein
MDIIFMEFKSIYRRILASSKVGSPIISCPKRRGRESCRGYEKELLHNNLGWR